MKLKNIEERQPEPQHNSDSAADSPHVSPTCPKPIVMRRFVEEDLDNCWSHYKSYLIDILNDDYDLNEAREDLNGLIGSKYDKRKNLN